MLSPGRFWKIRMQLFCQRYYDDDMLDKKEMNDFIDWISPEMVPVYYSQYTLEKVHSTLEMYDSTGKCFALEKTKDKKEYKYGRNAEQIVMDWTRVKELDAIGNLTLEQRKERSSLLEEMGKLLCTINIDDHVNSAHKKFEIEFKDYLEEQTKEADTFRATYEDFQKSQQDFIKALYKGASEAEIADIEAKHRIIQRAFLHEFRHMTEKRVTPLYESYKDYRPEELADFISIMENVIDRHQTAIIAIMGTDVAAYRKK